MRIYKIEGGNSVNVVVIGIDKNLEKIEDVFNKPELGYRYKGFFGNKKSSSQTYLGTVEDSYQYIMQNNLVRHFVKPGVTGLAQIKGYRGEIIKKTDIINRVRMDVFYIEKWCLMLDIKIIYFTILNGIRGEEKAY